MTKLWLYGYSVGVCSSRRLATLATRDVGVTMLAAGSRPDFRTLSEFRRRHLVALAGLFTQVVQVCASNGLVQLREVSIDGTRIKASASKHAAMSYSRMGPEVERIEKEIAEWLSRGDDVDREEDEEYGVDQRGDELPEELQTAEKRRAAIKEAMRGTGKGGQSCQEGGSRPQGTEKLYRPRVTDHERGRRVHPGVQHTSGGGCQEPGNRGAIGDIVCQRCTTAGTRGPGGEGRHRTHSHTGVGRCRVLQRGQHEKYGGAEHRCVSGAGTNATDLPATCLTPGEDPCWSDKTRADEKETAHQEGQGHLPPATGDRRASVWADKQQRITEIPASRADQGAGRMGTPRHMTQHCQAGGRVGMTRESQGSPNGPSDTPTEPSDTATQRMSHGHIRFSRRFLQYALLSSFTRTGC